MRRVESSPLFVRVSRCCWTSPRRRRCRPLRRLGKWTSVHRKRLGMCVSVYECVCVCVRVGACVYVYEREPNYV